MKSSPKTDQATPGQCKGVRPSGHSPQSARQLLLGQIKSKDNPVDKEVRNPFDMQFFKPNLFNLFNLVGFMICFSFYSKINQLELHIQHLELTCRTHSENSFQRKVELNTQVNSSLNRPESLGETDGSLPVSIVEFVDRVSLSFWISSRLIFN